jgi:DNA-binding MarR family transcriptional regulator
MDEAADGLHERIIGAQRRVFRAMRAGAFPDWAKLDLSMAQLKVLMRVACGLRQSLGGVAQDLGISPPTASHLVDRLVRQGLVERREDPEDRRRVLLATTPLGEDLVERLRRAGEERLRGWLERMAPGDVAALARGMEALARVAGHAWDRDGEERR